MRQDTPTLINKCSGFNSEMSIVRYQKAIKMPKYDQSVSRNLQNFLCLIHKNNGTLIRLTWDWDIPCRVKNYLSSLSNNDSLFTVIKREFLSNVVQNFEINKHFKPFPMNTTLYRLPTTIAYTISMRCNKNKHKTSNVHLF